jgi:proline dehydrogenase
MLASSEKVLGRPVTEKALKATLFGHFCAGEDADHITPVLENLEKYGIGFILDYATEGDSSSQDTAEEGEIQTAFTSFRTVGRIDLESEAKRDKCAAEFKRCIHDAASIGLLKGTYVAIRLTALADPDLLNRISRAVTETKRLFEALDIQKMGRSVARTLKWDTSKSCCYESTFTLGVMKTIMVTSFACRTSSS